MTTLSPKPKTSKTRLSYVQEVSKSGTKVENFKTLHLVKKTISAMQKTSEKELLTNFVVLVDRLLDGHCFSKFRLSIVLFDCRLI